MEQHLQTEDVERLIGRLVLNHELQLRRQETVFKTQLRQLQGDLDAAHAESDRLRAQAA